MIVVCDFSNRDSLVTVAKSKEMIAQSFHFIPAKRGDFLCGQHLINGCQYRRQEWNGAAH
jgi:hypothetical protein